MAHREQSPLAGQTLLVKSGPFAGEQIRIEDWWNNLGPGGQSWMSSGSAVCYAYGCRIPGTTIPFDDEVLYDHIDGIGHLVHVSELAQ